MKLKSKRPESALDEWWIQGNPLLIFSTSFTSNESGDPIRYFSTLGSWRLAAEFHDRSGTLLFRMAAKPINLVMSGSIWHDHLFCKQPIMGEMWLGNQELQLIGRGPLISTLTLLVWAHERQGKKRGCLQLRGTVRIAGLSLDKETLWHRRLELIDVPLMNRRTKGNFSNRWRPA